jgi:tetratricopeptide (TPR) repeat protein
MNIERRWNIRESSCSSMIKSRVRAIHSACAIAVLCALVAPAVRSQSETKQGTAIVDVVVCDPQRRRLSAATLTLQRDAGAPPIVAQTDSQGRYRFSALSDGTYTVHAKLAGYRDAINSSVIVAMDRVTSVVLVLEPAGAPSPAKSAPPVEYSDEPQFTVAGVTDPTSLGGHGSDTVLRTKEALAKETAALNHGAPDGLNPASTAPAASAPTVSTAAPAAENFPENERAGKLLLDEGKPQEALPYLERAGKLQPDDYNVSYALALAYAQTHQLPRANQIVQALLAREDRAELHALLADNLENERQFVEAAREYQRAAEMNPSEPNLFAWGAELLLHRAYVPASEVFQKGHRLFPKSSRMLVGLGVASYAGGSPEQGIRRLLEACDLDPSEPNPYLFLGKIQDAEKSEAPEVLDRFKRFVRLQPQNAMAYYYYAVGLAKTSSGNENSGRIETLLLKSIALDPHFGDAHLHLGVLYSSRRDFPKAISAYQKAVENTALPAEAHFRLAQLYRQMGKPEQAQQEIKLYDDISEKEQADAERDRHEIGQFVYTLRGQATAAPAPSSNPR